MKFKFWGFPNNLNVGLINAESSNFISKLGKYYRDYLCEKTRHFFVALK